jgi:DNA ligase D-like protein (predicted ligase)
MSSRSGASKRRRPLASARGALPEFVPPQLTQLVEEPPAGPDWAHEIKYDGYRIHARLDRGRVALLTRTALDWTHRYGVTAQALAALGQRSAYLDGELCAMRADGTTSFAELQAATDEGRPAQLVYFVFDLLFADGRDLTREPLLERKERLRGLLKGAPSSIQFSDHHIGNGKPFLDAACKAAAEGIVSKRIDAAYAPGERGLWRKTKCYRMEEFVIAGWSDPEGSRPLLGALLLAYYDDDGRLVYAGRVGTGMSDAELRRVHGALRPLHAAKMPLDVPPPRKSRFGSRVVLSRIHWVRPELVCEVRFLTWTGDGLLRQAAYVGLREDKPARDVRRAGPAGK